MEEKRKRRRIDTIPPAQSDAHTHSQILHPHRARLMFFFSATNCLVSSFPFFFPLSPEMDNAKLHSTKSLTHFLFLSSGFSTTITIFPFFFLLLFFYDLTKATRYTTRPAMILIALIPLDVIKRGGKGSTNHHETGFRLARSRSFCLVFFS